MRSGAETFGSASKEQPVNKNHDIIPDGYNIGRYVPGHDWLPSSLIMAVMYRRDELVAAAVGTKSHGGVTYQVDAKNITGIMPAGSDGVNHGMSMSV